MTGGTVITDSVAYIPVALIRQYSIEVVPIELTQHDNPFAGVLFFWNRVAGGTPVMYFLVSSNNP